MPFVRYPPAINNPRKAERTMPSWADWIGSLLYLLTGIAAVTASRRAPTRRSRLHWRFITVFIIALIPWRLLQIEEAAREILRAALVVEGLYSERTNLQILSIGGLVAVGAVAAGMYAAGARSRPWQLSVSGLAVAGMLGLNLIRLVSLHMLDRLIYASIGPFHLHYFAEFALLVAIGWASFSVERAPIDRNFHRKIK
jgi:hypothetical protein